MRWGSERLLSNASHFPYRPLLIIFRRDAGAHGYGVLQLTEKRGIEKRFYFHFYFSYFVCAPVSLFASWDIF